MNNSVPDWQIHPPPVVPQGKGRRFAERFLPGAVLAVLAAAVVLGLSYFLSMRWGLEALQLAAAQRATSVTSALFVPIEEFRYFPKVLASHSTVLAALQDASNAELSVSASRYLAELNGIAKTEQIYVIDRQGTTIAASNWQSDFSFVGHNFAFRPYFQDAMQGKEGRFYGMGTVSGTPGYYISSPVYSGTRIIGAVVVKIDLTDLDRQWQPDRNFEVTVADQFGINFLSSLPEWKYRPSKPLTPDHIKRLVDTRQYDAILREPLHVEQQAMPGSKVRLVSVTELDARGRTISRAGYVVEQRKLGGSQWAVSVFMPTRQVQERALHHTAIALAMLAFAAVAGLYWREQRKRIADREASRKLIEAAHAELAQRHRQLESLSEELRLKAVTDPLLGCYNRRYFLDQVGKLVNSVNRHQMALSIVVLDVDHFKRINDRYGHPAGDLVLQRMVDICSAVMRQEDILARFGGEEFIIAFMHTKADAAAAAAERLRAAVESQPYAYEETSFAVTVSCGVAQYDPREANIERTIRRADQALYAAKRAGRNRVILAPPAYDDAGAPVSQPPA